MGITIVQKREYIQIIREVRLADLGVRRDYGVLSLLNTRNLGSETRKRKRNANWKI
jgi:hypothetical protein